MNVLLFNKILVILVVFPATLMALGTKLPINKITPMILNVDNPVLLRWHRWAGWIALAGLVLQRWIYLLTYQPPVYPLKPGVFAHGVLITLCAVAFLYKVWSVQHTAGRRLNQKIVWWASIIAFGAGFAVLTCALIAWRWANPPVTWDNNNWLIYQVSIIGHVALAMALIWLGRLALVTGRESNQINNFEVSERQAGSEFTKTREKHQI
jgi:hypothetical protein